MEQAKFADANNEKLSKSKQLGEWISEHQFKQQKPRVQRPKQYLLFKCKELLQAKSESPIITNKQYEPGIEAILQEC